MPLIPLVLVLLCAISTCKSITGQTQERIPQFKSNGILEWVPYKEKSSAINASTDNVRFYYFSSAYPMGVEIPHDQVKQLQITDFNSSKPTYFVIHGWLGQENTSFYLNIDKDLIKTHEPNVIVVDWSRISTRDYVTSFENVIPVGKLIGKFIKKMIKCCFLSYEQLVLVGHSLGAHIAGTTGASLNGQASVIVGLDPAGPLFSYSKPKNLLKKEDANYVHVIHTNAGELGFLGNLGHSDFWPNGGTVQSLCIILTASCSHWRATDYYGESVGNNKFVASACTDYSTYLAGDCDQNQKALMGGYPIDTSVTGTFYLTTNGIPPFGKG